MKQHKENSSDRRQSQSLLSAAIAVVPLLFFLQGCRVGPTYQKPTMQAPDAFKELATPQQSPDGTMWTPAQPQDSQLRDSWWGIYQEPELNALEEKLESSNQNIAQAYQNYTASRTLVAQARASYWPTVATAPSYTRARTSQNQNSAQRLLQTNPNSNVFDLPFDISWEPDLWGKIHNTVRAQASAAQASAADLANVKLSEQANLALYYFELRGQDALQDLYDQTVETYRSSLKVVKLQSRTGVGSEEAVAQAELNLKTAQAAATNLSIARAQYEHAIALLIGKPASEVSLPRRPLTTPIPGIPVGAPSDLLQRRPDIAAAERTMAEANALIGVRKAAYYPSITIGGSGGFQSSKVGSWFSWPSRFFSIGPTTAETLFDGGARKGAIAQYQAQYEANVAAYRQTVLSAFQQTEDYLASQRILAQQVLQQEEAVAAAQRYLDIANVRYKAGVDTYLNVYTAQNSLLNAKQTAISLHIQQMTSNVQLIKALGGGWTVNNLPTAKDLSAKK